MCLEIRDGADESECRICSEKAAQVLGLLSVETDVLYKYKVSHGFWPFSKGRRPFPEENNKEKNGTRTRSGTSNRDPRPCAASDPVGDSRRGGVQERLVPFALAVAASGLGLGHGMTCSSNHPVFCSAKADRVCVFG